MGEKLIAFVFVVESCKGIINISIIIHMRFVDSFEKQTFVIADKNVNKRGTHSNAIYLPVHYTVQGVSSQYVTLENLISQ